MGRLSVNWCHWVFLTSKPSPMWPSLGVLPGSMGNPKYRCFWSMFTLVVSRMTVCPVKPVINCVEAQISSLRQDAKIWWLLDIFGSRPTHLKTTDNHAVFSQIIGKAGLSIVCHWSLHFSPGLSPLKASLKIPPVKAWSPNWKPPCCLFVTLNFYFHRFSRVKGLMS